ncbi:uncharacterized protein LOC110457808 isoform X2 [Mizuhopecten yessoensis]|uniref:uncharacterized protein LOC110457808 isoform X2 n=1 Tax=Mizuhopecten yessoensis TaxID=6573 RepID=UPI000B4594C5|nr:uncharacterized protein LOC110457808 isoform X2 [Mizuhopecten yessoensis]
MSTKPPQTRHKVFPPQRMHTRSRSNVNTDAIIGSTIVRSDTTVSPQSTQREEKGTDQDTKDRQSKLITCDTCGNLFETLGGLRRHQVTHIKKQIYKCAKCQQDFTLKVELSRHMQTHVSTYTGDSDSISVHQVETNLVSLLKGPPQVDRLQDFQDNLNIKESITIQKLGDTNSVSEFQLDQQSKGNISETKNLAQGTENMEEVCHAEQESIIAEGKSDLLLEQVIEHCLAADEIQASEVTVKELGQIQPSSTLGPIQPSSTLGPVGKNQELTNIVTAENETYVTVEHDNDITDLLLQDDCFKASNQQTLCSSNSQRENQKATSMDIKSSTSLLSIGQSDMVVRGNTAKLVNYSKELVTSGQTVNTTVHSNLTSGQTVNTTAHSNMTSGVTTIGHLKAAPSVPNQLGEESAKLAQLSDKHVSIKSHFSKEDIDKEVTDDPVLGLVSGLVKFCPDLSETDYTEVAKVTGVTVIMLDKQKIVVHGSWKALNRAYAMIENLQVEAKKERECVTVTSPMECVTLSSPVECVEVTSPADCVMVASPLESSEDQLKQNGVESGLMVADDSDPDVAIETSNSVDLDNLTPISMMEPDTFLCDKCSKLFWSRRSLQEHIALRHSEHKCKMCNKVFSERRYLQTHLKRHANVRNYTCSICGWKFMERFKMKLHMESHKERKDRRLPYKCTMCGNQFYNRASWSDHLNTHTGNRPYSCMLCSNSFAHRIGLKRHMVTHLKDKPYKCGQCGRSFSFRSKLTDHMTMHTGISKHRCSHCGRIFTASSSLRRHMEQCTSPTKPPGPKVSEETTTMEMTVDVIQATDTDTIYMCGICAETFDSLVKAEKHTIDHEQGVTTTVGDDTVVLQDNQQVVITDNVTIISEQISYTPVSEPVIATEGLLNCSHSNTPVSEPVIATEELLNCSRSNTSQCTTVIATEGLLNCSHRNTPVSEPQS